MSQGGLEAEPTDMADDGIIAELLDQLRVADPAVRCGAAAALSAFGPDGAKAIGPLVDALGDHDEYVRCEAANSLGELAGSCLGVASDAERSLTAAVPTLVSLLDDPSEGVRGAAAWALERLGTSAAAALPRLRQLVVSGRWDQAKAAARAVEAIAVGPNTQCEPGRLQGAPTMVSFVAERAARGGVESCVLGRDSLHLRVSSATAERLRGAAEFQIEFAVGDAECARLRKLMRVVSVAKPRTGRPKTPNPTLQQTAASAAIRDP